MKGVASSSKAARSGTVLAGRSNAVSAFVQRHRPSVIGVLHGFDRVRIRGTLHPMCYADGMGKHLSAMRVRLKDFKDYALAMTERLRRATERARRATACRPMGSCRQGLPFTVHRPWGLLRDLRGESCKPSAPDRPISRVESRFRRPYDLGTTFRGRSITSENRRASSRWGGASCSLRNQ